MSSSEVMIFLTGIICLAVGATVAYYFINNSSKSKVKEANKRLEDAHAEADRIASHALQEAENAKKAAMVETREEILELRQKSDADEKKRKNEISTMEKRVLQREESLDKRSDSLDRKERQLTSLQGKLENQRHEVDAMINKETTELERIAALTQSDAKQEILDRVRGDTIREQAQLLRDAEQRVRAQADKTAREIISTAIQRCAADQAGEITVTSVHIPTDDLKGRIIGREGRNIRTFEQISGVSLVIDDTPETVVLSSFSPVRREIARVALENLIADGRIHPARIEEMYKKAENLVGERIIEAGEQACFDAGIHDLHPELIKTLGSLRYRTSFGQNVLDHSIQVSALCGLMASELGLDPTPAKRAGLLHDLGKAIDHEVEGPHAVIGAELCRRFGEKPDIVHAIEAHHSDVEAQSVLDVLVQAADAISAARPGARRESAEIYIKRLERLEEIANSHDGVERTYAMQAGRELHVMVKPERISDAESIVLAHDIANQIENEMEYPGQVRVVVIRESRAIDVAK